MPATKQSETPEVINVSDATEPKKEIMGIERDDKNVRLSFTPDGNLLILTMPLASMSPALVHGFVYELHDIIKNWFMERKKHQIITRDTVNKFSFKNGISKLFR